jgi:hypothetical protein
MVRRKKSQYRHIIIDKKKYYFYSIRWLDILGDSAHADSKEFKQMKPAQMVSQAYVFSKDDKLLRTFASYDENEAVFSDRNVFPIGVIKTMEKIKL